MKRKPKVLRIIARLNVGGPSIHVTLLERGLADRWDSTLVAGLVPESEGDLGDWVRGQGVEPLILAELSREISPTKDLRALWALWRLMRRLRPDIVHTHTAKAGTLGRLAAVLAGVKVIVHTFHGHTFHGYFSPRKTYVFMTIERILGRFSDAILGVSQRVCQDLRALRVGRGQVRHLPLGLELERFTRIEHLRGELRAALGIDADAPLVGIVARLVPIKRHDRLLRAAAQVLAAVPEARFAVVGDGELRPALEQQAAALGIGHAVVFAGWRDDLERVLADLDVVALTSDNEGLPVAIIEALAAGRPVVATDVGGVSELLADGAGGYVVGRDDEAALAARLIELLSDRPAARALGQRAQDRALRDYAASRLVRDVDALYRELLGLDRGGHCAG